MKIILAQYFEIFQISSSGIIYKKKHLLACSVFYEKETHETLSITLLDLSIPRVPNKK